MSDTEINAVSLKLPKFWSNQPEVWFAQTESQFAVRKITEEVTKFHYVVSALDQESAVRVLDIIQSTPKSEPYTTLKTRLLGTYTLSEYERANKLLNMPALGDSKPSYLMDQMMGLLGENKPCFLFKQIFLNRLPDKIRSVLVHSGISDCRELATAADKLHDAFSSPDGTMTNINKISTQKPRNRGQNRDRNSGRDRPSRGLCFYHFKFGEKAHRCEAPCNWQQNTENESAGSQ